MTKQQLAEKLAESLNVLNVVFSTYGEDWSEKDRGHVHALMNHMPQVIANDWWNNGTQMADDLLRAK